MLITVAHGVRLKVANITHSKEVGLQIMKRSDYMSQYKQNLYWNLCQLCSPVGNINNDNMSLTELCVVCTQNGCACMQGMMNTQRICFCMLVMW